MMLLRRFPAMLFLALAASLLVSGSALAAPVVMDDSSLVGLQATADDNDDRDTVVLGTLAAVGVAGVICVLGYLYRRQTGKAGHYDDGFTPRDPRDHPAY